MRTDPKYQILFESVPIGPVTARNRFYQVPHCCGLGHLHPQAHAAMRTMKAEGGWAVVSTEEAEIHPSSDLSPYSEQRIWDERDIPALQLMTNSVHDKGALAAIELVHNGNNAANHYSRIPPIAPVDMPLASNYPKQARAMSKTDIRELRRWHRAAALRAKAAGFDIVYVYAGHIMTLAQHFLLPQLNTRNDEYGGKLENRVRLVRELIEDTKDAIGDSCAIAFRFAVDEMLGPQGMQAQEEGRAIVELLAELPDLWDVNVADWSNDSASTRFVPEDGYQIEYVKFVKTLTSKPVVATGRLNSPDLMASLVNRGIVDFIGAARPSIADPFLPNKIKHNQIEQIRECIGCNICVSCDSLGIPIRCTQNPTMGEEWRRNWHPEKIAKATTATDALVIGAGPAGLECAMQLARRGHQVTLADAATQAGGRVSAEATLKGLNAWRRVRDNRIYEIERSANIQHLQRNQLSAQDAIEFATANEQTPGAIFIATGAHWRNDGVGRSTPAGITGLPQSKLLVLTPDDIMNGAKIFGEILIYDDEHGYMGGVLADHIRSASHPTTLLTSASIVSPWTEYTLEQSRIQRSLIENGVRIVANRYVSQSLADDSGIQSHCVYTHQTSAIHCNTLVLVTSRRPNIDLYSNLTELNRQRPIAQQLEISLIGDALAPGLIADAIYSGHLAARDFQRDPQAIQSEWYKREIPSLHFDQ